MVDSSSGRGGNVGTVGKRSKKGKKEPATSLLASVFLSSANAADSDEVMNEGILALSDKSIRAVTNDFNRNTTSYIRARGLPANR